MPCLLYALSFHFRSSRVTNKGYLAGTQGLWKDPQGGMDIGDDIQDLGFSQDKVISPAIYRGIRNVDKPPINISTIDIRQQLEHLVNTDLDNSEVKIRLTELAKDRKASVCALEKILKEIEAEADRDEQRPELKIEVDRLTTAKSTSVNIHQILPPSLAKLQQEYNERYAQEWAQYEIDAESWKPDSGAPKPIAPHHHVVYTNNMTMEAVDVIASKQPEQSAIYIKDELKAIFMSANQYRQGDDIQTYLSRYDGEQLNRIRTGSGFISSNHDIKFTMVGTIQPGIISKLSDNQDDDDGLMSRFLFSNLNCRFVPMAKEGGVDIVDMIANTYNKVHKLPPTIYKLNSEAFRKFAVEFDRLRINSLDTSRKGWERNVWSKAGGQLGRLILNLHLIWLVNDVDYFQKAYQQYQQTDESQSSQGVELSTNISTNYQQLSTTPIGLFRIDPMNLAVTAKIPPETVERAIELIRYFVDQSIGLIAEQSGELSPQLTKILELSKKKGSVTPRIIIHSICGKNRPTNTKQAIELLKELTAMGYGRLEQKNRVFVFTPNPINNVDSVDNLLIDLLITQTVAPIELEPVVDIVDTPPHPLSTIDQLNPKPPTVDRPISETVTINNVDSVDNLLIDLLITQTVAPIELEPVVDNVDTPPHPLSTTDQLNPKPPTVDRPVTKEIEVNPYFKYQMTGDQVDWLELAFHSERTANQWDKCLSIVFSAQTRKPHPIERKGKKWILSVKGVTLAQIKQLETMNIDKAPEQIYR
jgi:Protein of unknown function (DUF3987)